MRFGITPLFINADDIRKAVDTMERILNGEVWKQPEFQHRSRVT